MTNLTDAVALAIEKRIIDSGSVACDDMARAAIAEFCRYLREPDIRLLEEVCTTIECEINSSEHQGRSVLRALATHIKGEGK